MENLRLRAIATLKSCFGYTSFREGQEELITALLSGQDAFGIMPTGAGKSLCYQLPALLLPGITLVISPLISLMQDQVKALNAAGIRAAYINSSLTEGQINKALQLAAQGTYKIIYAAPERLESFSFQQFAQCANISMVTVDEAHCISQWGQDFRPSYLRIPRFVDSLPVRPICSAFTATATRDVKEDVCALLGLRKPLVITTGFDRPNLYFRVEHTREKDDFVLRYLREHPDESGIIYCSTRKAVESLQVVLEENGFAATRYHAGLTAEERRQNQNDFIYDRKPIIAATNAFGMGIDKSDVRFVIHYTMPQSMENYYQEAGRAGRDGLPAQCILLFSPQDIVINRYLLERKDYSDVPEEELPVLQQRDNLRLQLMERYCKTTDCLRNTILTYFGEAPAAPCDNCGNCHTSFHQADMTAEAKWFLNCVAEAGGRYGKGVILGTLQGANRARLRELGADQYRSYGKLKEVSSDNLNRLLEQLLAEGYLVQSDDQYSVLGLGNIQPLKDGTAAVLVKQRLEDTDRRTRARRKASAVQLTESGAALFGLLRALRTDIAREEKIAPYMVLGDKSLTDICAKAPNAVEQMMDIYGMGKQKYEKYAARFFDVLQQYRAEHPDTAFAVPSEPSEAEPSRQEKPAREKKVLEKDKPPFFITPEQAEAFQPVEDGLGASVKALLNVLADTSLCRKITVKAIQEKLAAAGYLWCDPSEDFPVYHPTAAGEAIGIAEEERTTQKGLIYTVPLYSETAQWIIVKLFTASN